MKTKELRIKSANELEVLLKEMSEKISKIQFEHFRARSKNVKESRELRRGRARILTLLQEKQS
ncbi:MAG: 50S ribosomal protein L29 [Patescibacteria group bacterium]